MNATRASSAFSLLFLLLLSPLLINLVNADPDELEISTSRLSYVLGATLNIHGTLTKGGNPIADGLIAVQVEDPLGNLKIIKVECTGSPPPPWKVQIVEFISCDLMGNPKSNFNRGSLAFFKVSIKNIDTILDRQVIVALNLFDSVGVSIGIACANFLIPPSKNVTFLTSIPIPKDAFVGKAIVCANALTNWPKDGGHPYCQEMRVEFTITDGSSQGTGPPYISLPSPIGSFNISFKLPNNAWIGKYKVYASGRYNAWATTNFFYMWLRTDVNTDEKVNVLDISLVAKAFGSKKGDPAYNSLADVNEDSIINILDITRVALDFGKNRF